VKIAAIVTILSAILIKGGTALASYFFVHHPMLIVSKALSMVKQSKLSWIL
jgi:hypothetical protein